MEVKPSFFCLCPETANQHWQWRLHMAAVYARPLNPEDFGVKAVYVIGSVKNAGSGPGSDLDLIIHFAGNNQQKQRLLDYTEGWSLCLAELNRQATGIESPAGLIDLHIVTDSDISAGNSFAIKIGAHTDPARKIK